MSVQYGDREIDDRRDRAPSAVRNAAQPIARASFTGRSRHKLAWTIEEADRLAEAFRGGAAVAALALAHGRTTAAIEHQLVEMEVLRPVDCQYGGAPRDRRVPGRAR